jgi:hypothetical protein
METKIEIQRAIEELIAQLKDKQDYIVNNKGDYVDLEEGYQELLDDIYKVECDALPISVTGSELIRHFDETMYNTGLDEYEDDYSPECIPEWEELEHEIAELVEQLDELEEIE